MGARGIPVSTAVGDVDAAIAPRRLRPPGSVRRRRHEDAPIAGLIASELERVVPGHGLVALVSGGGTILEVAGIGDAPDDDRRLVAAVVPGRAVAGARRELAALASVTVIEHPVDTGDGDRRALIVLEHVDLGPDDLARTIDVVLHAAARIVRERRRTREGVERLADRLAAPDEPVLVVRRPGDVVAMNAHAARRFSRVADGGGFVEAVLGVGWRTIADAAASGDDRDGPSHTVPCELDAGRARLLVAPLDPADAAGPPDAAELLLVRVRGLPREDGGSSASTRAVRSEFRTVSVRTLVGTDSDFLHARQRAERFARTSLPILLVAETGAGKEVLARAIHDASPRSAGPFVPINCASINPDLLASELFGYGPGAFTGASANGREGRIAAAEGGSLFLDEVAEMPPVLQASLLRVLEDGSYYRVGEAVERRADIRLICATWRDLTALVHEQRFRRDLYYRIKGACIRIPPLREREDVLEIANFLLDQITFELKRGQARLDADAIALLHRHRWPGNIRELRAALHHAVVMAEGRHTLRPEHLPPEVGAGDVPPSPRVEIDRAGAAAFANAPPPPAARSSDRAPGRLEDVQRRALEGMLEATNGNMAEAARRLGISRSTAYRMADRFGLRRDG